MMKIAVRPILFKEFRTRLRGSGAALILTIYVGMLLIAVRLVFSSVTTRLDIGAPLASAQVGQAIFTGLALAVQVLTLFLAPATTVNSISSEFERRTFDALLLTPLNATSLLLGKLFAALAFLLLLLCSALPLFSVIVLFGGVEWGDLGRVFLTLLASALPGCMLGLLASALTRQTYSATLLCYALLIGLISGTIFAANLYSATNSQRPAPAIYVVANPLSTMASALIDTRPVDAVTPSTPRPLAILGLFTQGSLLPGSGLRTAMPLYRAAWLLYTGVSILLFWGALHAIQPRRRWQPIRADAVILGVAIGWALIFWLTRDWWMPGFAGLSRPML